MGWVTDLLGVGGLMPLSQQHPIPDIPGSTVKDENLPASVPGHGFNSWSGRSQHTKGN